MHSAPARPAETPALATARPTARRRRAAPRDGTAAPVAPQDAELRAVLELSGVGAAYFGPDGVLRFANQALVDWIQPGASALAGRTLAEVEQALRQRLREPQALPAAGGLAQGPGAAASPSAPLPLSDGRWLRLQWQRCPQGGLVLAARDVTHEVEVDRMRSEFLSTAAHELRNPMASILGFSELLMTRSLATAQTQELAGIIHRQSTWLVGMVNELLDLARIESRRGKDFRLQALPLQPWLDDTVAAQGAEASRVQLQLHDRAASLWADPAKARQALANVLSNALKYSPEGGPVVVSSRAQRVGERPGVTLAVQDHGIGMETAAVARIFERFYRANPSGDIPGTGLGMSLVQEIMTLHRGEVQVDSRPGRGTTVSLWFPAAAGQAAG